MATDKFGHETRFSDSSLYDERCTKCGATDAAGDDRLDKQCPAVKKTANDSDSPGLGGCATELAELKKCMERGFMALHLEVAPAICNDLRNTVYAVINHLEGNE